jgi:diguanylate cyclase (GGDEF)-like protein
MRKGKSKNRAADTNALPLVKGIREYANTGDGKEAKRLYALQGKDALLELLLSKFNIDIFEYNVKKDVLFYTKTNCAGIRRRETVAQFRDFMLGREQMEKGCGIPVLDIIDRASAAIMDDVVEYRTDFWQESFRWYRSTYKSIADDTGKVVAIIGYTEDVDDEVQKRKNLLENAQRDILTNLYNQETTEKLINGKIADLQPGEKGIFFLFDIDGFKQLNETLGQKAGDSYLRSAAALVRADFRYIDIVGRIGGDEFVIFLKGRISIDIVEKRAQQILDIFLRVQLQDYTPVSCSIGIAVTSSNKATYENLLLDANMALREIKVRGGHRYRMFEEDRY